MTTIWPIIGLSMLFYAMGEYCSKLYANTHNPWYGCEAVLAYAITGALFLPALSRHNHLAIVGSIWNVSYAVITLLLAVLVFHERVTLTQGIGLVFGLIAILLLSL